MRISVTKTNGQSLSGEGGPLTHAEILSNADILLGILQSAFDSKHSDS